MSWDVYVTLDFNREQAPLARLIETHRAGHSFFLVQVLHANYLREPIARRVAPEGRVLRLDEIASLAEEFQNRELAAEGLSINSRFDLDTDEQLMSFEYRSVLRCMTPDFHWPALQSHTCNAVYDAGDYKHYLPSLRGEAAVRNIEELVQECARFTALEVKCMRGLDAERSTNPEDCWLVFHRQTEDYTRDLNYMGLRHGTITRDSILNASLECDEVTLIETDQGPIVYANKGVVGHLRGFYETLARASLSIVN